MLEGNGPQVERARDNRDVVGGEERMVGGAGLGPKVELIPRINVRIVQCVSFGETLVRNITSVKVKS